VPRAPGAQPLRADGPISRGRTRPLRRSLPRLAASLAALALLPLGGALAGPPAPGGAAIASAEALAAEWGRCPTARPAHRVLARAKATREARPRARRARAAVRAWEGVARDCARPVDQPTVSPGA